MVSLLLNNWEVLLRHFLVGSFLGFISLCLWSCSYEIGKRKRRSYLVTNTVRSLSILLLFGAFIGPLSITNVVFNSIYTLVVVCLVLSTGVAVLSY